MGGGDLREADQGAEGRVRGRAEQDLGDGRREGVPQGVLCFAGGGVRFPQGSGQGEGGRGGDLREAVQGAEVRVRGRVEQDLGAGRGEGVPQGVLCFAGGGV